VWSGDLSINYNKKISKTPKPSKILAKILGKHLEKIKKRTQKSISYNI